MSERKKKGKALPRRVVLVLAALLLGLNIYKWNARSFVGNQLPMPFGYGISVVLSGSMEPTLQVNDLVIIRETDQVKSGDIVVYQSKDVLVIHRVVEVSGDVLIAKGDANNAADDPIALTDVKGIMAARIPGAGVLVQFIRQPLVVAGVLIAAVLLTELSFRKDKQKDQKELDEIENEIRQLMTEIEDDPK